MEPTSTVDFFTIYGIMAIGNGLLIFLYFLLRKKGKSSSPKLMAFLVFILAIELWHNINIHSGYILQYTFMKTGDFFYLAIGPLIFLLNRSIMNQEFRLRPKYLWHFVPFIIYSLAGVIFYFYYSGIGTPVMEIFYGYLGTMLNVRIFTVAIQLHAIIYFIVAAVEFWKSRERVTFTRKIGGKTKISKIGVIMIFLLLWILLIHPRYSFRAEWWWIASSILISAQILGLAYVAFNYALLENRLMPKYAGSVLTPEKSDFYLAQLDQLMTTEKLYLSPNLKLPIVADRLGINSKYLSQVINEVLNKKFTDYINKYRVDEAKKKLLNSEFNKYTIEAIGQNVGFQSKDAFYRAFNKEFGIPPSKFKQANKSS